MDASLNYFTCTLGEAASRSLTDHSRWTTINQLINHQAVHNPTRPAVGFFDKESSYAVYNFQDLHEQALRAAQTLKWRVNHGGQAIALLCSSGRDFLFSWLGLIRMGFAVLLIAPEVPLKGIASLLQESHALTLLHDEKHAQLAHSVVGFLSESCGSRYKSALVPSYAEIIASPAKYHTVYSTGSQSAYIHHTSGTSTGKPKSIYITHYGAVGALPILDDSNPARKATFTTTPLYHGGPADCFRSWTSSSLIWLFPGVQDRPITADNVMKAIDVTNGFCEDHAPGSLAHQARVRYFTAVPYVVESLAGRRDGVKMLRSMELVGVGGAALSISLGDQLVREDVNLLSRYGSAECGFIMSSRRDYHKEKDWQYLRQYPTPSLSFERQDDGLAELVLKDWPFMAKKNRPDGSYATSDLFMPDKAGTRWKYHSRADSQLTLSTGKKFDPSPTEDQINAVFRRRGLLKDSYIFGDDRPSPGVLLFRAADAETISDDEIVGQVWPVVAEENLKSAPHARISKDKLIVVAVNAPPLQKTNKGTIIRRRAEEDFKTYISKAYDHQQDEGSEQKQLDETSIMANVHSVIKKKVPGVDFDSRDVFDQDLYSLGADSIACMEVRSQLQRDYGQQLKVTFPPTLVYECGSTNELANHIIAIAKGIKGTAVDRGQVMNSYVKKYANILAKARPSPKGIAARAPTHGKEVVVLTGVTGTLGVYIFHILRMSERVGEVHCLIRGADQHAAQQRLVKALEHKKLPGIEESKAEIKCHPCKLHDNEKMGLEENVYLTLLQTTTLIIHAAWAVNFNLPLKHFDDHFRGLTNLLLLAKSSPKPHPPRFLFCSSTASVLGPHPANPIPSRISTNPNTASPIGYAESKWIAEAICASFLHSLTHHPHTHHLAPSQHPRPQPTPPITVLRIGQLTAASTTGIWNATEAWPLMLSSARVTGALPALREKLDWLMVDVAAEAVVEVAFKVEEEEEEGKEENGRGAECPVHHILNPHATTRWPDLLSWIKSYDPSIEILEPALWVQRLESAGGDHPARKLLGLWREAYCGAEGRESAPEKKNEDVVFEMEGTLLVAPVLGGVGPVDEVFFRKVWRWVGGEAVE